MKHLLIAALVIASGAPAYAQSGNEQPIEITAVETVEWLRNKQQYVARKDVIVTQGTMQIFTDLLTADYREGETSSTEIYQITAKGSVRIKDETNIAYGDHGVYDVIKGVATLTGENLKLVSPDQTVTARDRMEYYSNEGMAKAIGNAVVTRPTDTLRADVITAFFKDDKTQNAKNTQSPQNSSSGLIGGGGNLDRLEADGNVVIKTPNETLTGRRAIYRADTNTAELRGNVKVVQGENVLEGERAEVNLTTNVSRMFGSESTGGRVRGVFFPSSGNQSQNSPSNPPAAAPSPTAPAVTPPQAAQQGEENVTPPSAPAKVSPRMEY